MSVQSTCKTVAMGYGALACVLLGTLLLGLISGGLFVGLAGGWLSGLRSQSQPVTQPIAPSGSAMPRRPSLGLTYRALTADETKSASLIAGAGALIMAIIPGSPAEQAGLQSQDIIVSFDGKDLTQDNTLLDILATKKAGDQVDVTVLRNGQDQTVTLTLGRQGEGFRSDQQSPLGDFVHNLERQIAGH